MKNIGSTVSVPRIVTAVLGSILFLGTFIGGYLILEKSYLEDHFTEPSEYTIQTIENIAEPIYHQERIDAFLNNKIIKNSDEFQKSRQASIQKDKEYLDSIQPKWYKFQDKLLTPKQQAILSSGEFDNQKIAEKMFYLNIDIHMSSEMCLSDKQLNKINSSGYSGIFNDLSEHSALWLSTTNKYACGEFDE